jgi:hypothetical protein|nr:DUF4345 domain-containing protein [uncultured Rhodoferax sp.]
MNKRALQIVSALMGTVPVITGLVQLMGIHDPLYASLNLPADATLDSNMRFLAGVWLGLGLASLWLVPRITEETVLFRVLWLMIFLGGIGRVVSMASVGLPLTPFIAFTALEILGAPLFVYWQHRVVQNS